MALIRVAQYNSTPTVVEDYQAQNAHLQAFTNQLLTQQFILDSGTDQPVIKQGCYVSHGGSLYVADADTSITGSPSDGSVYIRVSGTTSLTVEFINDISGYTWNPVYTALTSGSYTILPYLIIKVSMVWARFWARYNFNPNNQSFGDTRLNSLAVLNNATVGGTLGVTGAISGASVGVTGNATVGGTFNGSPILSLPSSSILSSFASPSTSPFGLAFDGTNLISCDTTTDKIYIHNGISSSILSSFASPGQNPYGLTFDGTNLISCDAGTDKIYIHNGISSTILSSFASPASSPSGLAFDGTNLISCDSNTNMIYIHNGISSSILSSFVSPASNPFGLAFDGTNLISCGSNMIYIHNGISSSILSNFAGPSTDPRGLAFDGTNLISCGSNMIYVHRMELKFLF